MTLDRIVICMFGVPLPGITRLRASAWQFVLRDRELVRFAGLDHEVAAVVLADHARNGAAEVTVAQPIKHDLADAVKGVAKLGTAAFGGIGMGTFLKHCAGTARAYRNPARIVLAHASSLLFLLWFSLRWEE